MSDNSKTAIESLEQYKKGLLKSIAIAIQTTDGDDDYSVGLRNGLRVCKAYIDGLEPEYEKCKPSAQPERKKGKWIPNSPVTMKCDQCGLIIKDWDWHRLKYCPNCDSVMNQKGGNSR